ncbi:MAG: hypothetical protein HF976_13220 [ANME-2 cluster archaeon]|nr:hypothetical protein [ANME-2 cluster archaeon]MBC2709274.1 hypothetical protein [ANME-2 cluster archaeon]MBC2745980.1 hypothetical protein [ANME-2 cluster archaeon]MBC2764107.1 hypothetical protein [ANME-2 cluster archaeon]
MSITIDVPKNMENILDLRSREEHIDRVSVLKQMLWDGVESYLVNQYSGGKISKGKLAELLNLDIYGVNDVLEKHHIKSTINYDRFTRGIKIAEESGEY